jgi:uncharacterized protein
MVEVDLQAKPGGVHLRVHVKPRASRSRVVGLRAGALDVAVAAPPVEGEANAELCRTLGRYFGIVPSKIAVVSGAAGRRKVVRLCGVGVDEVRARIGTQTD